MEKLNIFRYIGRQVLGKKHKDLKNKLLCSGLKINHFDFMGLNLVIGIVLTALTYFITWLVWSNTLYSIAGLLMAVFLYYLLVNSIVSMFIDQRARYVETVLPDALQLMAANLRSGVSTDEALVLSARDEFGFLAERIKIAGDKLATGVPFSEAFLKIPENIKSDILKQTIGLIIEGEASGGELSTILEGTAIDIRDTATIQKEVKTVIMVYATFIFLAVAFIAPILYAVSTQLASVLSSLSQSISVSFLTENSTTLNLAATQISQEFLLAFSYTNLVIIGTFGSLMISLINKGSEKYGLKYIPIILGLSLMIFYIGRLVMNSFFGGIRVL